MITNLLLLGFSAITLGSIPDVKPPTILVDSPKENTSVVLNSGGGVTVEGRAFDNVAVGSVVLSLTNSLGTQTGIVAPGGYVFGIYEWGISLTGVAPGQNIVQAYALDTSGNASAIVTRTFTVDETAMLTINTSEGGVVSSNFNQFAPIEIGKNYTVTAVPQKGYIFQAWTISDGIPSDTFTSPKLIFSMTPGLTLTATFVRNPFAADYYYNGLVLAPDSSVLGGIALSQTERTFIGTLFIGTTKYKFNGQFDKFGNAIVSVNPLQQPPIYLSINLGLPFGTSLVTVNVLQGGVSIGASQMPEGAPPALGARYNMFLEVGTIPGVTTLAGDGFLTGVTNPDGRVNLTGQLPDGTNVTTTAFFDSTGTATIYLPLYGGQGVLQGQLVLADTLDNDISGTLTWTKPVTGPNTLLPVGFTTPVEVVGSIYTPPARYNIVSPFSVGTDNALLETNGVGLPATIDDVVTLTSLNTVNASFGLEQIKVSINPETGLVIGSYLLGPSPVTFYGIVGQKEGYATGYFYDGGVNGGFNFFPF